MPTMPYWLAKTPEMIAMDKWFSLADGEPALVNRYLDAIVRLTQPSPDLFTGASAALDHRLSPGPPSSSFAHLDSDWLNLQNPSSGGNYWPQIPTWLIIIWLQTGIVTAAKKALGATHLSAQETNGLFEFEREIDPNADLQSVLPLVTLWVCTAAPGSGGFEVDSVRGPTSVQLVISTPAPYQRAHIWDYVRPQIDRMWQVIHHGAPLPDPPPDPLPRLGKEPPVG